MPGNTLTLSSATFDTSTEKFGSAALSGGYGQTSAAIISTLGYTLECWVKGSSNPGAIKVAIGSTSNAWIGCDASGYAHSILAGGTSGTILTTTTNLFDGNWHHLALTVAASTGAGVLYVDGTSVATCAGPSGGSSAFTFSNVMGVGAYGGTSGFTWVGEVDEAVVWPTVKYTGTFTPPTAAYTGSEGMTALWHLDSNGTDSSAALAATAYTLTGPSTGLVGVASSSFTVTPNGTVSSTTVVTPSAGGAGGTFTPSTVTFASGSAAAQTFTYTAAAAGAITISASNNSGLTNPGSVSYTASATGTIAPNNSGIIYSPYNWLVSGGAAETINPGAYFSTIFAGASCALTFNTTSNSSPLPELFYRIDGWAWTKVALASSLTLTMPADSAAWPEHTLEVVVKSTSEFVQRWSPQDAAVTLTGITLASGSAVRAPSTLSKNILVLGDSITEGYHAVNSNGSGQNDPDGSDALNCYAFQLGQLLGANVGVVGFGGTGLLQAGVGGVPALTTFWNTMWSGQARSFSPAPDLIVINIGTNDGNAGKSASAMQTGMASLLAAIHAALATSRIAVLQPFQGAGVYMTAAQLAAVSTGLSAAVTAFGSPASYFATTGVFAGTDSVDGVHPLGITHKATIAPQVAELVRSTLYPTTVTGSSAPSFRSMF